MCDMKVRASRGSALESVLSLDHELTSVISFQGNLYVGIKKTGGFQHSSFLYGARVTAAGLIKVDKGKLTSLSPLSGHYRAGTMHFKAFVRQLEEKQVDMSSVSISKSVSRPSSRRAELH